MKRALVVVGVVLLSIILALFFTASTSSTRIVAQPATLALITNTPVELRTPTPVCPNTLVSRLILNQRGRVSNDDSRVLNVRTEPGTSSRILHTLRVDEIFFVIDGPECTERYSWYRIAFTDEEGETVMGWIAEGDPFARLYFVELYPLGW